jgi:hypothetical protein
MHSRPPAPPVRRITIPTERTARLAGQPRLRVTLTPPRLLHKHRICRHDLPRLGLILHRQCHRTTHFLALVAHPAMDLRPRRSPMNRRIPKRITQMRTTATLTVMLRRDHSTTWRMQKSDRRRSLTAMLQPMRSLSGGPDSRSTARLGSTRSGNEVLHSVHTVVLEPNASCPAMQALVDYDPSAHCYRASATCCREIGRAIARYRSIKCSSISWLPDHAGSRTRSRRADDDG